MSSLLCKVIANYLLWDSKPVQQIYFRDMSRAALLPSTALEMFANLAIESMFYILFACHTNERRCLTFRENLHMCKQAKPQYSLQGAQYEEGQVF